MFESWRASRYDPRYASILTGFQAVMTQLGLAAVNEEAGAIAIPDGMLHFFPAAFSSAEADALFGNCLHSVPWRQDDMVIAGRRIAIPRLQNWFGDPGMHYSYSGINLSPLPWTDTLQRIRERVQRLCGHQFNALLANCYRNGMDSVGWHSDDERELGTLPVIASVSFGATRTFEMRHIADRSLKTLRLPLHHGSVLIMSGQTQQFWHHQIPKEKGVALPRVNLTFRQIFPVPKRG